MDRTPSAAIRRRRVLQLAGAAAAGSLGVAAAGPAAGQASSLVVEQAGECHAIDPLTGEEPVADRYDYAYPSDRFDGPPGSRGDSFSSEGTTDLQRDNTSVLFLYDGPDGLSLVVVHGHLDGDRDRGGVVTFTLDGLPDNGDWIVRDDYYHRDGQQADSNNDRWDVDGAVHTVDWAYRGGRTDGGAFRGLHGADLEVTVEPAFNDAAALAVDHDVGPIETWEVLSDEAGGERIQLSLDEPVAIRAGSCEEEDDDRSVWQEEVDRTRERWRRLWEWLRDRWEDTTPDWE